MAQQSQYVSVREFYEGLGKMESRLNDSINTIAKRQEDIQKSISAIEGGNKASSLFISTAISVFGLLISLIIGPLKK